MKKNFFNIVIIIAIIAAIFLARTMFSDHNLKRTISACIVAQKQTAETFDPKKAKEFCEKSVKKKMTK